MSYNEPSVADWESRLEFRKKMKEKEKHALEIQRIQASGLKKKRIQDALKTKRLDNYLG